MGLDLDAVHPAILAGENRKRIFLFAMFRLDLRIALRTEQLLGNFGT